MALFSEMMDEWSAQQDRIRKLESAMRSVLHYIKNYDGQPNPLTAIEETLADALVTEQ
jgi:hypothetical protein